MRKFIVFALILVLLCNTALAALPESYITPSWVDSKTLRIPDSITRIESEAYYGDDSITELYIPDTIAEIGRNAFAGCENLDRIVIYSRTVTLNVGSLGTAEETKEIWAPAGSTAEAYAKSYGYTFVRIPMDATDLLTYAVSLLGTKYGHYTYSYANGSYTYSSLDCVFFVYVCYRDVFGITLCQTCPDESKLSSSINSLNKGKGLTATKITDISDLMPGDIICWSSYIPNLSTSTNKSRYKAWYNGTLDVSKTTCTHVGIYIGGATVNGYTYPKGSFIDASSSAGKVQIGRFNTSNITSTYADWYVRNFMWAWRIL